MNIQVEESLLGNSGEGADDGSLESNKGLDHIVLLLADGLEAGGQGGYFLELIAGEEVVVTWCQGIKDLSKLSQTNRSCFKSCLKPDSG